MDKRIELHNELKTISGYTNLYFQPPDSLQMKYPAIRYYIRGLDYNYADNKKVIGKDRYEIIILNKKHDMKTVKKILTDFEYSSFDRSYISDGIYHYVLELYY